MGDGGYDPYSGEPVPVDWSPSDEAAQTPSNQRKWVNPTSPSFKKSKSRTFKNPTAPKAEEPVSPAPTIVNPVATPVSSGPKRERSVPWVKILVALIVLSTVWGMVHFVSGLISDAESISGKLADVHAHADDDAPKLRKVKPTSVIGPTWAPGDATYTMAPDLWDFAFRTPKDFNCFARNGEPDLPHADAEECDGKEGFLAVVTQYCKDDCSAAERKKLNTAWMGKKGKPSRSGKQTYYEQLKKGKNGRYEGKDNRYKATLTHYCGKPPHAFVAVYIEAKTDEDKPAMQKTLNDVVSQCG